MRFSRDHLIFILLILFLVGLAIISAVQRAQNEQESRRQFISHSTHSATATGALALQLWLDAAGYRTTRIENRAYAIDTEARALVILGPWVTFTETQVDTIANWVARGNTLVVAEDFSFGSDALLKRFQIKLDLSLKNVSAAHIEQPLRGAVRGARINVDTGTALEMARDDYVTYLSAEGKPLLVNFPHGKGRVWFSSAPDLFVNENLPEDANAALVMALFSSVPRGSLIAFDEYHLGFTGESGGISSRSIQQWLFETPWGWGILYSFAVGFVYLLINGKRFGRATPLPQDIARRSPGEYVTATANLFRRAHKRDLVARHYHQQLKRALGKPYRISADLSDAEFVDELARYRDDFDRDALVKILRALEKKNMDEHALVKLAEQAVKMMTR